MPTQLVNFALNKVTNYFNKYPPLMLNILNVTQGCNNGGSPTLFFFAGGLHPLCDLCRRLLVGVRRCCYSTFSRPIPQSQSAQMLLRMWNDISLILVVPTLGGSNRFAVRVDKGQEPRPENILRTKISSHCFGQTTTSFFYCFAPLHP